MRKGCPARRGISTPPTRGRRRLARRPLPARGCVRRTPGSAWRSCAPPHAGTGDRWAPSHAQDADRAHLHGASRLEDRAAFRDFDRLRTIPGLDKGEAVHDVLGLGIRPVVAALLLACDDLACALERMSGVLHMALFAQLLEPGEPFLHGFLHLLGRSCSWIAAAKKKRKFAHCVSSRVLSIAP